MPKLIDDMVDVYPRDQAAGKWSAEQGMIAAVGIMLAAMHDSASNSRDSHAIRTFLFDFAKENVDAN